MNPLLFGRIQQMVAAVYRWLTHGMPIAQRQKRMAICRQCYFRQRGFCAKCGCLLALKNVMATEGCPLDKWPLEVLPSSYPVGRVTADLTSHDTRGRIAEQILRPQIGGGCGCGQGQQRP